MESFLGAGSDIPSVPDGVEPAISTQTAEDLSQAPQPALEFKAPFSEPSISATVRSPSPQRSDLAENASKLLKEPPISPTLAPAPRERRLSGLQLSDHIPISPAAPSPTAIPIHFRTPRPSADFARSTPLSSPGMALDSPSSVVPRTRHARPGSTEFRPLWLVERHKSREQFDPEEPYPSLPSSKTTSRSSSVHDTDDVDAVDEITLAAVQANLISGVDVEHSPEPQEFLDSQQSTPVATRFPLAIQNSETPGETQGNLLEAEDDHDARNNMPNNMRFSPSSPSTQSLDENTSKSPENVQPAHFEDLHNLPPLPPSSNSSEYDDEELLSSSAIKDAAVAMGTLMGDAATAMHGWNQDDEQMLGLSGSSDHIHSAEDIVPSLETTGAPQKSTEPEMEPDLPSTDRSLDGPYWQPEHGVNSTPGQGAIGDDLTEPATPSQAASLISAEQQCELQELDAQDAVDSWFAPPTPKNAKKEKQGKKQEKSKIPKSSPSNASPSASASSLVLTGALPLVALEALPKEHHDLALPEGLVRSQSDQDELNPEPVSLLEYEAEQDGTGPEILPPFQPVEDEANWPARNRKAKKGKGKRKDKLSKMPATSVEAVSSNGEQGPRLAPEYSIDQKAFHSKSKESDGDRKLGGNTRALEENEKPDVLPQDELSIPLPSETPLETEAFSEYLMPSKKSKKDKKKAKQARPAAPSMEVTAEDSSFVTAVGLVDNPSRLVPTSSQPEDFEVETRPSVSGGPHVTDTPSNLGSVTDFATPARRKSKAKKKNKLDLRSERELSFDDANPTAAEIAPRQIVVQPASSTLERSITANAKQHTEPLLEPEPTLEVTDSHIGSPVAIDEPNRQDLGQLSPIPAEEATQSTVQELSPFISAYPLPDDAPDAFLLEERIARPLSPDMIPLPEDEDLGVYDVLADEEPSQETEVSHVIPSSEVEKEDLVQENNRSADLESVSGTPGAFATEQSRSILPAPEMIPLPPSTNAELDQPRELKPLNGITGALPTEEPPSVQEGPEMITLPQDKVIELASSPVLKSLDETPGAFPIAEMPSVELNGSPETKPSEETPSVQEAPEMVPLPSEEDVELMYSPPLESIDQTPGAFPETNTSAQNPLPPNEDDELNRSATLKPLSETPGAFPKGHNPSVPVSLRSNEHVEPDRSATLEPPGDAPGGFPEEESPPTQTPLLSNEAKEANHPATLESLEGTPGAFPKGQNSSTQLTSESEPLLGDRPTGFKNISDHDGTGLENAVEASDDSDVVPAVTAKSADMIRPGISSSTSVPLADDLPGAFPMAQGAPVQVAAEMDPLPSDEDENQTDSVEYNQARSDTKDYASELDEVTPISRVGVTGHMRQLDDTSATMVPDTELPGAFPDEQITLAQIIPEHVPLPPDEDMDQYKPQDDDEAFHRAPSSSMLATPAVELPGAFPTVQTAKIQGTPEEVRPFMDSDKGLQRTLSSPMLSTPAVELPGAFPAGQNIPVQDLPGDIPGNDDDNDNMQRQVSSSELATPAVELPGAFPTRQSALVPGYSGDVRSLSNGSVDIHNQEDDLQSLENAGVDVDSHNNDMRPEAIFSDLATPAVELPGAFPGEKIISKQFSPTDIPLPPDENMDIYIPLEDDQYLPKPAIELPGAFPGSPSLTRTCSTELRALPEDWNEHSQSTIDNEQSQKNTFVENLDVQSDLSASTTSPKETLSKRILLPVLKNLIPAVSASARNETNSPAIAPEAVPLPEEPDIDLDDTANEEQAAMVSAAFAVPSTERSDTGQGSERELSSTSADPPRGVTHKPLLPEMIPLPEKIELAPHHASEAALLEDIDRRNSASLKSPLLGNADRIPDIAPSIPLPEDADLELLPPEIIPLSESVDRVHPVPDTTAQAKAGYSKSSSFEIVPRQEDMERKARLSERGSSRTLSEPDGTEFAALYPPVVPWLHDADSRLQGPSSRAEMLPTTKEMTVESEPSQEEPMFTKTSLDARDEAVERAGAETPSSEQAEEAASDEFFVRSRKKGKKAKKQQLPPAYIKDKVPKADYTEESPSMLEAKVRAQPESTVAETRGHLGVLVDQNQADDQLDRQEVSATLDTESPLDRAVQSFMKKGKRIGRKKNLSSLSKEPTTLITPSSSGIPSDIPHDRESSATEFPESVQESQASDDTPREVQSHVSTPSEGPLGRPLEVMKGLLGMSAKQKKKKGKKNVYLEDPESSSAVSEEPIASAQSDSSSFQKGDVLEGDGGFETKQSKKSKKGKKIGKVGISTSTDDSTASAMNDSLPATPPAIAVENPTMTEDQWPITATERFEVELEGPIETSSRNGDQPTTSTPLLKGSAVLPDFERRDMNLELEPPASDTDYLREAAGFQLPPDDPADFPVEEQERQLEGGPYEPSSSLRKSKKPKKKAKKFQAGIEDDDQPVPMAVPDSTYQQSTADTNMEPARVNSKVFDEPDLAASGIFSTEEARELPRPPFNVEGFSDPSTVPEPTEYPKISTDVPKHFSSHNFVSENDVDSKEPLVMPNEPSDRSDLKVPEQATSTEDTQQRPNLELTEPHNLYPMDPRDVHSFTTSPSGLDFPEILGDSELPRGISEYPNLDTEQLVLFNDESAAANERPPATDLNPRALEAGQLEATDSPIQYAHRQPAITDENSIETVSTQPDEDLWAPEISRKAKKSKQRQKGAVVPTEPGESKETTSDLYEYPERSLALPGTSHELTRSGGQTVRESTSNITMLEPSLVEGAEPQAFELEMDPEGHTVDDNGSEQAVSRSLGGNASDVVLDSNAASHTKPVIVNNSVDAGIVNVPRLTEEYSAEDNGKDNDIQEDEWPGELTTKAKSKKGKKQRRNGRAPLEAEFTDGPSTSATSPDKPQQLEAPMPGNTVISSLKEAPVASVAEEPFMPRQDDDFSNYTSTKKGKKGKESKEQLSNSAWYNEATGSGASTPAEAPAARFEPPEAEISRDKVEDAFAEPPAQVYDPPQRTDVVRKYPDEFMEMPGEVEAPASKNKVKNGKKLSKQGQSNGEYTDTILEALPVPADIARDTVEDVNAAVLQPGDADSKDEVIRDDLPALPPSGPESRMSEATEEARTEDDLLRDRAVFEPLPASRPTSPTALPIGSAAHTQPRDERLRNEIPSANLPALPRSRPDSPLMTPHEIPVQDQPPDKHLAPVIPEETQPALAPRELSPAFHKLSEPAIITPEENISTSINEPAQIHGYLDSPQQLSSPVKSVIQDVEAPEASQVKDISHSHKASIPLDDVLSVATTETLQPQPTNKDPKKEKKKNKKQKQKRMLDWTEQEEELPTHSPSLNSDKELEPQAEGNDLPSTTLASRGFKAEQPQQLNIQSGDVPDQESPIVSPSEYAPEQRIRTPPKVLGGSQFNRDSAVHVSDSPLLPYVVPEYSSVRDSGYQETTASPIVHSTNELTSSSELQSPLRNISRSPSPDRPLMGPNEPHLAESCAPVDRDPAPESITSPRNPLRISVELDPAYEISVSKHNTEMPRSSKNSSGSVDVHWNVPSSPDELEYVSDQPAEHESVLLPQHDQRQPSPVESATKDRSSVLFLSSPSTREDSTDQPNAQLPGESIYHSAEETSQTAPVDVAKSSGGPSYGSRELSEPQIAAAERVPHSAASNSHSEISETPSTSLFGGPVGINSDNLFESSLPPASSGYNGSERTPLDTIAEHSPEDSPLVKKSRPLGDIGSPEQGITSMRRSATSRTYGHDDLQSPPVLGSGFIHPDHAATAPDNGVLSTDDFIARLSWPAVDEDNHSVDLDRVKSRNTDRRASNQSNGSARVREGEIRSTSGQSIRSGGSINRFRTPDRDQITRPTSGVSNRSASGTGTPPLRRVDRRLSGDLRAANKRSEAKFLAKQPDLGFDVDPHIPSSSTYDPIKDKGKGRVRGMTDVYVSFCNQ